MTLLRVSKHFILPIINQRRLETTVNRFSKENLRFEWLVFGWYVQMEVFFYFTKLQLFRCESNSKKTIEKLLDIDQKKKKNEKAQNRKYPRFVRFNS